MFVRIALALQGDPSSLLMFAAALALSIAVTVSLSLRGSQEIRRLVEKPSEIPRRFWL
jgi:hypothetical protein